MKLSSLGKGGGLFAGTAITGNRTLTEADLSRFFTITAASVITLPKPSDIKSRLGEEIVLISTTDSAVSLAVAAGVTIDGQAAPFTVLKGVPIRLLASSGTSWALVCVHPISHPASMILQDANNRFMTDLERARLGVIGRGCRVAKSSDQTLAVATATLVSWQTEVYDDDNAFAAHSYTAPADGRYFIMASVNFGSVEDARMHNLYIKVNGYILFGTALSSPDENSLPVFTVGVLDLDAGDVVNVWASAGGTTARTIVAGYYTQFQVHRI